MFRLVRVRLFALVVATTTGLVTPVGALAHGFAHYHDAHRAQHDETRHSEHLTHGSAGSERFDKRIAEGDGHGEGDHGHPALGAALTAPAKTPVLGPISTRAAPPTTVTLLVAPQQTAFQVVPRSTLAHAPPPRVRAPPSLLA